MPDHLISTKYELDCSVVAQQKANWLHQLKIALQQVTELPNAILDHLIIPYVGFISEAALDLVQQMKETYIEPDERRPNCQFIQADQRYIERMWVTHKADKLAFWTFVVQGDRRKRTYLLHTSVYTEVRFLALNCERESYPFIQDWLELLHLLNCMFPNLIGLKVHQQSIQDGQHLCTQLLQNLLEFVRTFRIPIFILRNNSAVMSDLIQSHLKTIFAQQSMNSILLFVDQFGGTQNQTNENKGVFLTSTIDQIAFAYA